MPHLLSLLSWTWRLPPGRESALRKQRQPFPILWDALAQLCLRQDASRPPQHHASSQFPGRQSRSRSHALTPAQKDRSNTHPAQAPPADGKVGHMGSRGSGARQKGDRTRSRPTAGAHHSPRGAPPKPGLSPLFAGIAPLIGPPTRHMIRSSIRPAPNKPSPHGTPTGHRLLCACATATGTPAPYFLSLVLPRRQGSRTRRREAEGLSITREDGPMAPVSSYLAIGCKLISTDRAGRVSDAVDDVSPDTVNGALSVLWRPARSTLGRFIPDRYLVLRRRVSYIYGLLPAVPRRPISTPHAGRRHHVHS